MNLKTVEKATGMCDGCQTEVDGFLIPDGRFVCPNCFPPAVFQRWQTEWAPIEKARAKAEAARVKADAAIDARAKAAKEQIKREKAEAEIMAAKKKAMLAQDAVYKKNLAIMAAHSVDQHAIDNASAWPDVANVLSYFFLIVWVLCVLALQPLGVLPFAIWLFLRSQKAAPAAPKNEARFPCPACGESIPKAAKVCRFCSAAIAK